MSTTKTIGTYELTSTSQKIGPIYLESNNLKNISVYMDYEIFGAQSRQYFLQDVTGTYKDTTQGYSYSDGGYISWEDISIQLPNGVTITYRTLGTYQAPNNFDADSINTTKHGIFLVMKGSGTITIEGEVDDGSLIPDLTIADEHSLCLVLSDSGDIVLDLTEWIEVPTWECNSEAVYNDWTDANYMNHRDVVRRRITGSFSVKPPSAAAQVYMIEKIRDNINENTDIIKLRVYINNRHETKAISAFLDFSFKDDLPYAGTGKAEGIDISFEEV